MAPLAARRTAPGGSSETQPCDALGKVENGTLKKRSEKSRIPHPMPPPGAACTASNCHRGKLASRPRED